MARQDTHTLQVWPSGQTYTYRGDPFAPSSNRRSLRRSGEAETRWRRGTPDEWQMIRVELRAERIAEQEIYVCDSALVDALVRASLSSQEDVVASFSLDAIENLHVDPSDWTVEQCREYLEDHTGAYDEDADADELREQCRDEAQAEVYEWYRVSSWLCARLRDLGEVVIENEYGDWWGRTCTGQAVILDGTMQRIAQAVDRWAVDR